MRILPKRLNNSYPSGSAIALSAHCRTVAIVLLSLCTALNAQQTAGSAPMPLAGSSWERVKALPAGTRIHITSDHRGRTCRIFSVTNDALTCVGGSDRPGAVLQRPDIKHIKLTHYLRSGLVGFAAGGGIGAAAGGIAGRPKPCPTTGFGVCLNGLGYGAAVLVVGVGSAIVGGVVGAATDLARGSSIYTRP